MKIRQADEIISSLDAEQSRRLEHYNKNLLKGRDKCVFDKRAYNYLVSLSRHGRSVKEIKDVLDSLRWCQSIYKPGMIISQAERFESKDHNYFGYLDGYKKAKADLIKEVKQFAITSLKYNSKEDIEDALPRSNTHAGFSFILTGKRQKGEYIEGLLENYLEEERKALDIGSFNKPILIGTRTQAKAPFDSETGEQTEKDISKIYEKLKSRMVSMVDIYQVLAECKFAKPFQQALSRVNWYAGGKDDGHLHHLIRNKFNYFRHWMSLDYSHYDQSISSWLIHDAFDIIEEALNLSVEDKALFKVVRNDFIHKVFILGDKKYVSHKGVPSGSMFTQIVDTLVNRLMIDTYMYSRGITNYEMMIMGDDNFIVTEHKLDEKDVSMYLEKVFGIEMNADKAGFGTREDDPEFLSRIWKPQGVWRSKEVLVAKLCFPERFREYDRLGFTTEAVIHSYFESFGYAMGQFFDYQEHKRQVFGKIDNSQDGVWMTGLMSYRKHYSVG